MWKRYYIIVHTTFMASGAVSRLLPEIEEAAKDRDIEIDIIWGERDTPGQRERNATAAQASRIETHFRSRHMDHKVRVARAPTDSHCKLILSDSGPHGQFEAVVGSCNRLSSAYVNAEISVRIRDPLLVRDLANAFATLQMPASGRWDRSVMRLVMIGEDCRLAETADPQSKSGAMVLFDDDHYAAIRDARDNALTRIVAGCDWLGSAAETSVFVPTRTAAREGLQEVLLLYQRADERTLSGLEMLRSDLQSAGVTLKEAPGLHGKFLVWDSDNLAITSFNWLSTAIRGYQQGASEIGILINAPGLGDALLTKLRDLDGAASAITDHAQEPSSAGTQP
jgi:phosphatidylserine/phosphatidylglycerophosphate/cardiolipin synthase-like enzyme